MRVSVIIPTYNREKFIREAVDSVLAQAFSDFELIVVDDGSTDGTAALLDEVKDSRLTYVRQENAGRSNARNRGIKIAQGKYIAFLDSDDAYLPDKLQMQVEYLDAHSEFAMVYTGSICVDEQGNELHFEYKPGSSGNIYSEVAFFLPITITLPTVMVRKEAIAAAGLFDERMLRFEDTDMWRRIAKRFAIGTIEKPSCRIRTHADNILTTQNPQQIVDAIEYYVDKISREDDDVPGAIREAGIRRLCQYYAAALQSVPAFASYGDILMEKARKYFNPRVSIIIPVYNGTDFLDQAIDSALAQTYSNCEIIVVNDGSDDGGKTERLALSYGESIRYFSKPNGGVATALNYGIERMNGDYFSWLSHDDLYRPYKIEAQINRLAQCSDPSKYVIYGDYTIFLHDRNNATSVHLPNLKPEAFRYFITSENILHGCTLLIPKVAFDEHGLFNPNLRTTQDYDLWFRMATTLRFVHYPATLVEARSHENQGTVRMSDIVLQECNELLGCFVEKLSEEEVCRGRMCSLPLGYLALAHNLKKRGFNHAGKRAMQMARNALGRMFSASTEKQIVDNFLEELVDILSERELARKMQSNPADRPATPGHTQERYLVQMATSAAAIALTALPRPVLKWLIGRARNVRWLRTRAYLVRIYKKVQNPEY